MERNSFNSGLRAGEQASLQGETGLLSSCFEMLFVWMEPAGYSRCGSRTTENQNSSKVFTTEKKLSMLIGLTM
jgi:hypothetical protein